MIYTTSELVIHYYKIKYNTIPTESHGILKHGYHNLNAKETVLELGSNSNLTICTVSYIVLIITFNVDDSHYKRSLSSPRII